jgi:HK97 family phage prohead protease
VANGALTRCTTGGGTTDACEGRAIRQANAVARRVPKKGLPLGLAQAKNWAGAPDQESFKLDKESAGYVEAAFSLFGKIDSDRDIVEPTAFKNGQEIPLVWAHDWQRPVGKGKISVEKDRAIFKGSFFLNTNSGRDAYETVKAMGNLQQWSWGFRVTDASMDTVDGEHIRRIKSADVFEVSPVLVGANRETHTVAIKSAEMMDDGSDIDDEALSVLLDAVGEGMDDDPPEDTDDDEKSARLTMEEEADVALVTTEGFTSRLKDLVSLRHSEGKVGRAISSARLQRLNTLEESLRAAANHIRDLVAEATPKDPEGDEDEAAPKKPKAKPTSDSDDAGKADAAAVLRKLRLQTERFRTAALSHTGEKHDA